MNTAHQILLDQFYASAEKLKTSPVASKSSVEVLITFGMAMHPHICLPLILDVLVNTKYGNSRRLIYNELIDAMLNDYIRIPVEVEIFAFMQDFESKNGLLYCAILIYMLAGFELHTREEALRNLFERKERAHAILAYFDEREFGHRLTTLDYAYLDACHKCNQKFSRK